MIDYYVIISPKTAKILSYARNENDEIFKIGDKEVSVFTFQEWVSGFNELPKEMQIKRHFK